MKNNDIKKSINYFTGSKSFLSEFNLDGLIAHNLAIEALEKQVPKKVENKKESDLFGYTAHCPNCKMTIVSSFNSNGCGHCRQNLDWE